MSMQKQFGKNFEQKTQVNILFCMFKAIQYYTKIFHEEFEIKNLGEYFNFYIQSEHYKTDIFESF